MAPTDFNFNNAVAGQSTAEPTADKKNEPAVA
jgi:hypothetical protein